MSFCHFPNLRASPRPDDSSVSSKHDSFSDRGMQHILLFWSSSASASASACWCEDIDVVTTKPVSCWCTFVTPCNGWRPQTSQANTIAVSNIQVCKFELIPTSLMLGLNPSISNKYTNSPDDYWHYLRLQDTHWGVAKSLGLVASCALATFRTLRRRQDRVIYQFHRSTTHSVTVACSIFCYFGRRQPRSSCFAALPSLPVSV